MATSGKEKKTTLFLYEIVNDLSIILSSVLHPQTTLQRSTRIVTEGISMKKVLLLSQIYATEFP